MIPDRRPCCPCYRTMAVASAGWRGRLRLIAALSLLIISILVGATAAVATPSTTTTGEEQQPGDDNRDDVIAPQPTCLNGDRSCQRVDDDTSANTIDDDETIPCDLYSYDYWVYAGREYARNEILSFGSHDPIMYFKQQTRKAFPRWNRYHHFRQVPDRPYEFIVAPGLAEWPLECHPRYYNVRSDKNLTTASTSSSASTLTIDRPILPGEPILQECIIDERVTGDYNIDTIPYNSVDEVLQKKGICLDTVTYHPPAGVQGEGGRVVVKAKRSLPETTTVAMGLAIHMHRAEFWNATSLSNEPLIAYAYGHERSDLLLLPHAPVFHSILTTNDPVLVNTKLSFDMDDDISHYLTMPTRYQFGEFEQAQLWVKLVTTRDVAIGEILYIYNNQTKGGERPVPDDFFPPKWLQREQRAKVDPITHQYQFDDNKIDLNKLAPGAVQSVMVSKTQQPLGQYLHRVGLPPQLIPSMAAWGEEMGILDHLKRYVDDKTLEIGADERMIFKNGTWWARRFDNSWQSNMHYVAVDDDESSEQFFAELYKGGFDQILRGVGEYFNLTQLTCYYPTFIVVSHCVQSMMHADSNIPGVFNMIFPITQVNDGEAELVLGADDGKHGYMNRHHSPHLHVPYVYERDHAILVGDGGMHGTSPTDYRNGNGSHRVVMSVYMGDFSNDTIRQQYIDAYEDPPYANYWPGQLDHSLKDHIHWKKDDPTKSIGTVIRPRRFPKHRPQKQNKRRAPARRYHNNHNNNNVVDSHADAASGAFPYSDDDIIDEE